MMTISVYGTAATVNENNPSFNLHTGRNLPHVDAHAVIGNGLNKWRETFKVSNLDVAEVQIKEVVQFFNDTCRPGERGRIFYRMYREDAEVAKYEDDEGMSGWLSPSGEFHPCGFGEHSVFAMQVLNNQYDYDVSSDIAMQNAFIPMSVDARSKSSHVSINEGITPEQAVWFNRFYYKLSRMQKGIIGKKFAEQGLKLDYDW